MSKNAAVETRRKPFRGPRSAYLRRIAVWGAFMPLALAAIFAMDRGSVSGGLPEYPGPRAYGAAVCVAAVLFGTRGVRRGDRRRRGGAVLALGAACAPCVLYAVLCGPPAIAAAVTIVGPLFLGVPAFALCAAYARIRRLARLAARPRRRVAATAFLGYALGCAAVVASEGDVLRFRRLVFDAASGDADAVAALRSPYRRRQLDAAAAGDPPRTVLARNSLPGFRVDAVLRAANGGPLPDPAPWLVNAPVADEALVRRAALVAAFAPLVLLAELLFGLRRGRGDPRRASSIAP